MGTRARKVLLWGLPAAIVLAWLAYVSASGQWSRIGYAWRSSVTMVFGSFVAGSTPQGGGAVAFPVFTKVLGVPAAPARTFSLSIQAVGMVTAALGILFSGKKVESRAVLAGGGAGAVGFVGGLFLLGDPSTVFWEARVPEAYVKVLFTVVLAALAYIVYLALDEGDCGMPAIALWTDRVWTGIVCAGCVGGLATALLGSGVDVFVFLFVVIVAGLHPRVGVPTSVLAMAMVSMTGFLVLGILDGQLATTVVGEEVVAVGGIAVSPLPALQYDLFGMWLAAVPIVVVGAPLGTVFVHMLGESRLIVFVAGMAALEVVSMAIFLEPLRTDPTLLITALVALGGALAGVRILHGRRSHILGDAAPAAQLPAPEMSRAG